VEVPAWLEGPSGPLPCVLTNISLRGGELQISPHIALPKQFVLRLTEDGKIRRGCSVIWIQESRVGVRFFRLVETAQLLSENMRAKATVTPLFP
jgi:hypothetical protein